MSLMREIIDEAIKLSKQLIELAQQGEWQQFEKLDAQRQKVVRSLNVVDIEAADADAIRSGLETLINLNETLEQTCQSERSALMEQLQQLQQGSKARKAYLD